MEIQVEKRDGTVESFSIDKLITSMARCGVPLSVCEVESERIRNWMTSEAKDNKIKSVQIRDRIIEELIADYPAEMDSFKVFKK